MSQSSGKGAFLLKEGIAIYTSEQEMGWGGGKGRKLYLNNNKNFKKAKQEMKIIQVTEGLMWASSSSVPQLTSSKMNGIDNRTKKHEEATSSRSKCFPTVSLKDNLAFSKTTTTTTTRGIE